MLIDNNISKYFRALTNKLKNNSKILGLYFKLLYICNIFILIITY